MSLIQEFKKFVMRGNVVDLAVAVIIGTAFGKVVTALVEKIFMPVLGLAFGTVDFSKASVMLRAESGDRPAVLLNYGAFIQASIDFLIIAFAVFMVIRVMQRLHLKEAEKPAAAAEVPPEQKLLAEIRDLLRAAPPR